MKKLITLACIVVLSACSTKLLVPTQTDADRGTKKFPQLTLAELTEGKRLEEEKCTACHGLKKAASFSEEDWKKIIPGMARKAEKANKPEIDSKSQDLILKYILTMREAKK
jgi:hypothetical protein